MKQKHLKKIAESGSNSFFTPNRTWDEYLGENEIDATEFFRDILLVEDIVSVIQMDDEEEEI